MNYDITDAIKEAIGQVAQNHELSAYAVMDLFEAVSDYVQDYLADQTFENAEPFERTDEELRSEIDELLAEDEPVEFGDPATLVADAEEFIEGCERADFIVNQGYGDHFLRGVRDRLNAILGDNG